jgi:FKBP-type peptidyl-prolyl cis-trans isomerase
MIAFLLLSTLTSMAGDTLQTKSGLRYLVLKEGSGEQAYANRMVKVNYVGTFENGDTFDVSAPEGFEFALGRGNVIKGWDEGVRLMKEGDKFLFFIPFSLAYGKKGIPDVIPPSSNLIFEIELLEVNNL